MAALGVKNGQSAVTNGPAVPFATSGTGKIMLISTVGNAGTVYIGGPGVTNLTGTGILKDTLIEFGHFSPDERDIDFSRWYVYGAGATDKISFLYLNTDDSG